MLFVQIHVHSAVLVRDTRTQYACTHTTHKTTHTAQHITAHTQNTIQRNTIDICTCTCTQYNTYTQHSTTHIHNTVQRIHTTQYNAYTEHSTTHTHNTVYNTYTQHSIQHIHTTAVIVPHCFSFPHRVVSLATRSHTKECRNSTHRWQWSTSLLLWPAVVSNRHACMRCGKCRALPVSHLRCCPS